MSIKFTSKNVKFPGALKGYTEKQLAGIEKIGGDIIDAEIIASQEKLDFRVEITLKTKMHSYHVEDRDPILKQALRAALGTLKAQAKKHKEKSKLEKKRKSKDGVIKRLFTGAPAEAVEPEAVEGEAPSQVTISENFSRKPLSVEEAIFFLEDSGENAYMFMNAESNKMSVVFYNKNSQISIIEAM